MARSVRVYVLVGAVLLSLLLYYHSDKAPSLSSFDHVRSQPPVARPPSRVDPALLDALAPPSLPKPVSFTFPDDSFLDTFVPTGRQPPGVEGYTVWTDLYLLDGRLIYAHDDPKRDKVQKEDVVSGGEPGERWEERSDGAEWWKEVGQKGDGPDGKFRRLPGITLMFHDEPGPGGFLPYFDHFVPEVFLPSLKALSLVPHATLAQISHPMSNIPFTEGSLPMPSRIMFPQCTSEEEEKGWKDKKGLNEWILSTTMPSVPIEHLAEWEKRALSGKLIAFEMVIIVDRWAAHRQHDTQVWGKMNSHMATLVSHTRDFFAPFRQIALSQLGISTSLRPTKPVVIYLDRNRNKNNPRLTDESHKALIRTLRTIAGRAEVHLSVPLNMRREEVVRLMESATIVITAHTGDLVETMWMPASKHATVFELFDPNSFVRENQLVSEMMHHEHLIVQGKKITPKDEWIKLEQVRSPEWDGQIEVDHEALVARIRDILDEVDKGAES